MELCFGEAYCVKGSATNFDDMGTMSQKLDDTLKTIEDKLEAKRLYHANKVKNDPDFKKRQLESNRLAGMKYRAAAREERERLIALGDLAPKRPGRPRKPIEARPANQPELPR